MHILSSAQFSRDDLSEIFELARDFRCLLKERRRTARDPSRCEWLMSTLFAEPSRRTRISFEVAMKRLGGCVANDQNDAATKGEHIRDAIIILSQYSDLLVVRQKYEHLLTMPSIFKIRPPTTQLLLFYSQLLPAARRRSFKTG